MASIDDGVDSNIKAKSTQQSNTKSTQIALSARSYHRNKYVSSNQVSELAIEIYKTKSGRGITYTDLLEKGTCFT
jgi:hypothetical protein